jgi:hypothetical protein
MTIPTNGKCTLLFFKSIRQSLRGNIKTLVYHANCIRSGTLHMNTGQHNQQAAGAWLTLSARAEYMYSATSHASCPDGVLVLRYFHKVVKWLGTVDFKI